MKMIFVILSLLGSMCVLPVHAANDQQDDNSFCSVGGDQKNSACNVQGGFFSEQEAKNVMKKDASPTENIYKEMKDGKIYLYLFYAYDCPHCKKAHEFLEELKKQYPELIV